MDDINTASENNSSILTQEYIQEGNKQRGNFLPIIAAIFLVLIVGVVIFYSKVFNNKTTSTVQPEVSKEVLNWKTAESVLGGYQIQYPPDWKVTEVNNNIYKYATRLEDPVSVAAGMDGPKGAVVFIEYINPSEIRENSKEWNDLTKEGFFNINHAVWTKPHPLGGGFDDGSKMEYSPAQQVMLAGQKAIYQESILTQGTTGEKSKIQYYYLYLADRNPKILKLTTSYDTNNDSRKLYKETIEKIISTFIVNNSSESSLEWKIYRNAKLGFEMRYPSSLGSPSVNRNSGSGLIGAEGTESSPTVIYWEQGFTLVIFPYKDDLDTLTKTAKQVGPWSDDNVLFAKIKDITIDNSSTAAWYTISPGNKPVPNGQEVYFIHNDQAFVVLVNNSDMSQENVSQILSTIKFFPNNSK